MKNNTDSKEKILTAASRLFQIKGYNATGLNEILKESDAPKGSLYYYFSNGKEELALEAIKLASQFIQTKIRNALDKYSNPIEAIQYNIKCIIENLEDSEPNNISIGLVALETQLSSEPLREACKEVFNKITNIYAEKLIENGIPKEVAQELGAFILVTIEGAITVSVTQKNSTDLLVASKQIGVLLNHYFIDK
jgi:TetR/AcrR family transcriptional repressor of lmrAB and yxaGH operons